MKLQTEKNGEKKSSVKLFFSGVLVMMVANILVKVIGLMNKIPLHAIIGDGGMGYYNSAYNIYVWFFMISTTGLPVAVSMMISESRAKGNFKEARRIFRVAFVLFTVVGLLGTLIMGLGSGMFANWIGNSGASYCIVAIAPTLFFICISSAMRGYFQGYQYMTPTAISTLIESALKLIFGILLARWSVAQGHELPVVAAYTVLGLSLGTAVSALFLLIRKQFFREEKYNAEYAALELPDMPMRTPKQLLRRIAVIAIPITISASVMSLAGLIDLGVVMNRLKQSGLTEEAANIAYGNYSALAVPMFNLPPALVIPISTALVPMISSLIASGDTERAKKMSESSQKLASIIAIPCALGLAALSEPILSLFYKEASVKMAAPLLSVLAISTFFVCMLNVNNAILQANKHERKPILCILPGVAVKLLLSYLLVGNPNIRMYGAPISTFCCYSVVLSLSFYFISKYVGIRPNIRRVFLRPLLSAVVGVGAAVGVYILLSGVIYHKIATLVSVGVAAVLYVILIFLTKTIDRDDIAILPKSDKITRLLTKLHLLK